MKIKKSILALILFFLYSTAMGQQKPFVSHPDQLNDDRFTEWIAPQQNTGVFYFRKEFKLKEKPQEFVVHVSADTRYRLYVNGKLVSWGPAVGDLENWKYETVDLAPFLWEGQNVVASQVWNRGRLNPPGIQSHHTAFILQANSKTAQIINTDNSWKVHQDEGYHSLNMTREIVGGGYIAGGSDSLIAQYHPWNWNKLQFNDSGWNFATELGKGNHLGLDTWKGTQWKLKPRNIPVMEQKKEPRLDLLQVKGLQPFEQKSEKLHFEIPANTEAEILLDNRVLTMGFPQLLVSGGKGSHIKIQYQEALFDEIGRKGNRDEWKGKTMKGVYDVFIPNGKKRLFEPLWIRVFRYVKITVKTKSEPLTIHDFYNIFTAYPLQQIATFSTPDSALQKIWDTSWRTARLCALETYMDCPYYEQLQYIGDTRIQAFISMYVADDDRLARNAIEQLYGSLQPMGLTKSAHPTRGIQIIPPFSLIFITMIHDYYMLRDDPEFVKQYLPGMKFILEWFLNRIDENGMLGPLPYWNHIDGGTDFKNGSPPGISEGGSAHISLLLAYALDHAAVMLGDSDYECDVARFKKVSASLKKKTYEHCFSKEKGLLAETPEREIYSQHTNIFGILTDVFSSGEQKVVAQKLLEDKSLIQTTLYFKYYLFRALKKASRGGEIINLMDEWKTFLDYGFTTFPEHGINSRSDCHAWSAHPLIGFLTITCGIEPASPGFQTVEIRPQLGNLEEVEGSIPHPHGTISVSYNKLPDSEWICIIELPESLSGTFVFRDKTHSLDAGRNEFKVK